MSFVDGFVVAVPNDKKDAYIALARMACEMFKEFGATRVVECWGSDVPHGKLTDFYGAVKAQEGETIVFSWIEWPDRPTRDAGNAKMMADPRMQPGMDMPFDGKRMIFGGFEPILDESFRGPA